MLNLNILLFASSPGVGLTYNLTQLAIDLKKRGHKIIVISDDKEQVKGLNELLITNGIKNYPIKNLDSYSPLNFYKNIKEISNIFIFEEIDLIHNIGVLYLLKSFLACKIIKDKKIVLITHLHSFLAIYMKSIFTMRIITIIADMLLFVCEKTTIYYSEKGLTKTKLFTVNNGINIVNYTKLMQKESIHKFNYSEKTVAYIANLYPWKGHKYYINSAVEVLKKYPDVKFLLIGDGPLKKDLKKLVKDFGIEDCVIFLGYVDQDKIPSILANIDIGVSSSLEEQFPWNILEMMSAGKPVVATDVGCTYNMVKNGKTGFLVPPKNILKLSSKIIELLENQKQAEKMGNEGKKLVKNKFSNVIMIENLEKAYKIAIKNKGI